MMPIPDLSLTLALTTLAAISICAVVALRAFSQWLAFKRAELSVQRESATPPSLTSRIEIADLKERLRKLEALAAGVDL